MRGQVPWQLVATVTLLAIALATSVSHHRVGDSIVIAVLLAPGLILILALGVIGVRHRGR